MSGAAFSGGDVLITQGRLRGMGGSEMIALEMAEHFAAAGSRVVVVARSIDEGIASMFTAVPGVEVRETSWSGLDDRLTSVPFSLVWVHHNVVPPAVLRGAVDAPVVFAHLSASVAAESPLVPGLEAALASAVVFNSPETFDAQVAKGLFERVPTNGCTSSRTRRPTRSRRWPTACRATGRGSSWSPTTSRRTCTGRSSRSRRRST